MLALYKYSWMRKFHWQPYIPHFFISFLLFACQRTWQPTVQVRPESKVQIRASIAADSTAEATIAPYRRQVTQRMSEVIGTAPVELRSNFGESPLGNFVTDLQRTQAAKLLGQPVDIGLMTKGGLRYIIPQGNVTVGDVFELMPFENELLVLTLPGTTVQKLFQFGAEKKILALANATFTIQNGQATNIRIGGEPFDIQKKYTLAVSDYLANGGDNLSFLQEAINTQKAGILLRDAIISHIRELTARGKPIEARLEGRVKVL